MANEPQSDYQHQLRVDELNRRAAERAHDRGLDLGQKLTEAATRDAQEAIRVILLINGGAVVAILAFVGALARRGIPLSELKAITRSLYFFCGGIVAGGFTSGIAYLANSLYSGSLFSKQNVWQHPYVLDTRRSKILFTWAWYLTLAGLGLAAVSLILFIVGVIVAGKAIGHLPTAA